MNDTTQQNGSNGNGHRPPFRIVETGPDLGQLILEARDEVVEDTTLSHGAARMFVRILDLSVRQASNAGPGVVTISQTKLAEKFGVSLRTIWNWKLELLERGVIWMSSQPMPNAWPIDTYHVAKIHAPRHSGDKTTVEGLWGNGARQRRPEQTGMGARQPGQVQIPGTGVRSNQLRVATGFQVGKKSSLLPANATPHRKQLPASPATSCGGESKQIATEARNQLRRQPATSCDGGPQPVATEARNQLRRRPETNCEHKKAKVRGTSSTEGRGRTAPPQEDAFEKWSRGLDRQFPRELESVKKLLREQLLAAKSDSARALVKRKLAAVNERLLGPSPDEATPAPVKANPVKPAPLPAAVISAGLKNLRTAVRV